MNAKQLFVHALTPLHPGTGRGLGVIDLPVAREVATGLPYLPGSSVKGVLRDRCGGNGDCVKLFGPDTSNADAHAGAVQFTDMRLLLLPVRSLAGTFAWVTSPFILKRLQRDCESLGDSYCPGKVYDFKGKIGKAAVTTTKRLALSETSSENAKKIIVLEDLKLETAVAPNAKLWANWLKKRLFPNDTEWQTLFYECFCIVHDDVFSFLMETATEIIARNQLNSDSKTTENLWYEEALPAETILNGLAVAQQVGKNGFSPAEVLSKVAALTVGQTLQLGGSATIGRGLCRLMMV